LTAARRRPFTDFRLAAVTPAEIAIAAIPSRHFTSMRMRTAMHLPMCQALGDVPISVKSSILGA